MREGARLVAIQLLLACPYHTRYPYSDLLPLPEKVGNLWWKYQGTPVVSLVKIDERDGRLFGKVLMYEVACLGEDLQIVFA
jgi:hypothetical protein